MSRDRFFQHQALGLLAGLGLLCSAPVAQATPETDLANCEYGIKAFFTKFYKYQEGAWTDILAKKNNAKATADHGQGHSPPRPKWRAIGRHRVQVPPAAWAEWSGASG